MAALPLPGRRPDGGQTALKSVISVRPRWRKRIAEVLAALAVYSLPLLVATRQSASTGIWLQTGIAHRSVEQVLVGSGTPPSTYALLTEGGIRRSSDEGITWLAIDRDLPLERWGRIRIRTLALDPWNPDLILTGTGGPGARDPASSAGLYASTDLGHTWQAPSRLFAGQQVQAIAVGPLPHGHHVCVATDTGIYCTDLPDSQVRPPGSAQWQRLDWRGSDARITTMALSRSDENLLFVGTDSLGLYVTDDRGNTWSAVPLGSANLRINDLMISIADSDWVYAATDLGVCRSTNGGAEWELLPGLPDGRPALALAGDPRSARILYAGMDRGGVYFTSDGGAEWRELKAGLGNALVRSLAVDPTDPSIVWAATPEGLWRYAHASAPQETLTPGPTEAASPTAKPELPGPDASATLTQEMLSTAVPTALPATTTPAPTSSLTPTPSPTVPTATLTPTRTAMVNPTPIPPPTDTATPSPTATDTPHPVVPTLTLVVR